MSEWFIVAQTPVFYLLNKLIKGDSLDRILTQNAASFLIQVKQFCRWISHYLLLEASKVTNGGFNCLALNVGVNVYNTQYITSQVNYNK